MSLQALEGAGLWAPVMTPDAVVTASTYNIDATGEKVVLVLRCPKAGVLDRFDFLIGIVTNSPDNGLRASLQGVNAADGQNNGTILGATNNAFVTYAHTVTTGWKSTNFGETVTVTRGQLIACVIDIPSFTVGDSVTLSHVSMGAEMGLPYGISAAATKTQNPLPIVALHYTTGYAPISPWVLGVDTHTSVTYQVGTAVADEWGLGFQVPFPCRLNAIAANLQVNAGADFEVVLYNSADVALATLSYDGDIVQAAGMRTFEMLLQDTVDLVADTTYRVTIRPTTANTVVLRYWTFQSAELMHTMPGGDNWYMTSRLNQAGSWTDYNSGTFRRPRISLHLTAFDDAVSTAAKPNIFASSIIRPANPS